MIDAARAEGVKPIAYTSVLRADTSPLAVVEHRHSGELLDASGVPFVLLRNGWYTEIQFVFPYCGLEKCSPWQRGFAGSRIQGRAG
jgi:uncharacterized protein YbjT (DUF2867 family)